MSGRRLLRVLILEDQPLDAELMLDELLQSGFELDWRRVDTRSEYLRHLQAGLDLILADYSLPQFNALQALDDLHQSGLDIPLIVVTGTISEEAAVACMKYGAADYLLKDRMARLGPAVVKALEDRQLRSEALMMQSALQTSEERHRLLFEHAGVGIGYYTLQGEVVAFNNIAAAYLGGKPEIFVGKTVTELFGAEAALIYRERIDRAARSHGSQVYEDFISMPSGEKWFLSNYSGIADASGKIVGVQIIASDITERKQAEQALLESERFARSTLDGLLAHIAIIDETGAVLAVNKAWRAFAEANATDFGGLFEGANYLDVCDRAAGALSEGAAEFGAGIRAVLRGEQARFEQEYPCHSPVEQRWFVGRVTRFPGEGPVRVVVAHENITRLKRAEFELAEERNLLRTLIDTLPDRIYAKDVEGRFILKNVADARQMGAESTSQVIGKTDADYYPPELAEQYRADDLMVIRSGRPLINREEPYVAADGALGWILTSKVPFRDAEGNVIGLIGVGRDITERKHAESVLIQRRKEIDVLYHASQQLSSSLDVNEIYRIAHNVITQVSEFNALMMTDFDEAARLMRCVYVVVDGQQLDVSGLTPLPIGHDVWRAHSEVIRTGETRYFPNAGPLFGRAWDFCDMAGDGSAAETGDRVIGEARFRSALMIPLKHQGHVTGVLQLGSYRADACSAHDRQILEALTNQIATALSNAHLYQRAQDEIVERKRIEDTLREHNRHLSVLNRVSIALAQSPTLPHIFQTTYEHVSQLVDCACFGITLYDAESQTLHPAYMLIDGERMDNTLFPPLVLDRDIKKPGRAYAVFMQEAQIITDVADSDPGMLIGDDRVPQSLLYIPMVTEGKTIGLLEFQSYRENAYGPDTVALLGPVANQVGLTIQNARLVADLEMERSLLEQRVVERTAQLNHTKERIETILNSSSDLIILCRPDGRIDQVNPAFNTTFRFGPDAVYNQPFIQLVAPEHTSTLEQAFATVVETRQPQRLEMVAQSSHGEPFEVDVVLSPIVQHDSQLLGIVCSLRDITERKKMEAQLRQMLEHEIELGELKSHYVSMAAHDLRNPLAAIQMTVGVLEKYYDRLSEEQRQAKYQSIHHSIRIMADLLNDTMALGQARSGKLRFEPQTLDLMQFVHLLVAELHQATETKPRIALSVHGVCDTVYMDAKLLRHILGNLLSNALKYSPVDSTVDLDIQCQPEAVVFRIEDRGIGIPKADQERLFEAFHRASNVGSTPGTGLGLAIVKQSVDLHRGAITFESEEGRGTVFRIVFPLGKS